MHEKKCFLHMQKKILHNLKEKIDSHGSSSNTSFYYIPKLPKIKREKKNNFYQMCFCR